MANDPFERTRDAHSGTEFPDADYVAFDGAEIIGRVYKIANGTQEVMAPTARGLIACLPFLTCPVPQLEERSRLAMALHVRRARSETPDQRHDENRDHEKPD